jgi:hypothetical protein
LSGQDLFHREARRREPVPCPGCVRFPAAVVSIGFGFPA